MRDFELERSEAKRDIAAGRLSNTFVPKTGMFAGATCTIGEPAMDYPGQYGRNPERGAQQLSEKVDNLLDQAGVVPSDPDRLRAYLVELVRASYQAGRTSVHREQSRR